MKNKFGLSSGVMIVFISFILLAANNVSADTVGAGYSAESYNDPGGPPFFCTLIFLHSDKNISCDIDDEDSINATIDIMLTVSNMLGTLGWTHLYWNVSFYAKNSPTTIVSSPSGTLSINGPAPNPWPPYPNDITNVWYLYNNVYVSDTIKIVVSVDMYIWDNSAPPALITSGSDSQTITITAI